MKKYFIKYGISGFGYSFEVDEFENDERAGNYAWSKAVEEYDSYAGIHGIRTIEEIMEEDDESQSSAELTYIEERESELDYDCEIYDPVKHDDYLS